MEPINILLKALSLLYRESLLDDDDQNSSDLVLNTISILEVGKNNSIYSDIKIIRDNLIKFIKDLINTDNNHYDKDMILEQVELILKDDKQLYTIFRENMEKELQAGPLRSNVTTTRKYLTNFYTKKEIESTISKAYGEFQHIKDNASPKLTNEFIDKIVSRLGALQLNEKAKDEAITDEIDFSSSEDVAKSVKKAKKDTPDGKSLFKTGWKAMNRMLQGGFKRGEMWGINALSHNFKTGTVTSFLAQFPRMNIPVMDNPDKKPLILFVSLEDDASKATEYIYKYLYYQEFKKNPKMADIDDEEISRYVIEKLGVNGFHIKMLRADPTKWTYRNIINLVLRYEAEGYEIHAMLVDYLLMVPTTGCITSGPGGTDYRDMYRRIRNFMNPRRILFITPQQLSTEAAKLLKNGLTPLKFTEYVAEKGYTANSGQLHQELDGELNQHKVIIDRKPYMSYFRGKHRRNGILDEKDKGFILPFEHHGPILEDIYWEKENTYNPFAKSNEDELFDF